MITIYRSIIAVALATIAFLSLSASSMNSMAGTLNAQNGIIAQGATNNSTPVLVAPGPVDLGSTITGSTVKDSSGSFFTNSAPLTTTQEAWAAAKQPTLMMVLVAWICRRTPPSKVDRWFRRLQLVSAGAYSLGHGGNDAQKTIGIIWMMLMATGYATATDTSPPTWVIVSCYMAIGLGTMFGGWRIVKTMGQKITKLKPVGGFCAETGGAMTLFIATALGIPVSTTHTITGAIVGVGSTQRASAVRWGVAGNIIWAWIFTIPASAFVAAVAYWASLQLF